MHTLEPKKNYQMPPDDAEYEHYVLPAKTYMSWCINKYSQSKTIENISWAMYVLHSIYYKYPNTDTNLFIFQSEKNIW